MMFRTAEPARYDPHDLPHRAPRMSNPEASRADDLPSYGHFIDGTSIPPASREYLPTEDPVTARAWARIARGTPEDVEAAVASAKRAFEAGAWPALSPSERGRLLWKLGDAVAANAQHLAEIERRDNGKLASEEIGRASCRERV